VAFSATPPADCTIDWYDASSGGNIVTDGDGVTSFSPTLTESTTYYAQARHIATGCAGAARLPVTATVHTAVDEASITGDASNTCPTTTVTLTATASGATTFTWYNGSTQVQTGTSSNYSATATGNYTVQGKNANCTGTTSAAKSVTIYAGCIPRCTGFRLYQTTSSIDGPGNWSTANSYCTSKGARLPTSTELQCMCSNRSNLPGGYVSNHYWSSNTNTSDTHITVHFGDCSKSNYRSTDSNYFRCVL
jgi:hypothetical protein